MWSEVQSAVRSLRRTAAFTTTVLAMLALGIGGSTAIFSVVNHVLLRPLPYADPGQLVRLYQADPREPTERRYVTGFAYRGYTEGLGTLDAVAASYTYRESGADLVSGHGAERLRVLPVSASYFDVLRAPPLLGRSFTRAEEQSEAGAVVLSHELWQTRFGGARDVLGSTVRLSGEPFTVVGIARPHLRDPVAGAVDIWQPLDPAESLHPQNHQLTVLGRLRSGVSLAEAETELAALDHALAQEDARGADRPSLIVPLHDDTVGGAARTLYVLLGAVGLLLLIVCVNVANLLLARATARGREFAVRAALGAGRLRLLRQLLIESLILAGAGGVGGVLLALFLLDATVALGRAAVPLLDGAGVDARVLAFALAASLCSALLFGLLPALRFSRTAAGDVMRENARNVTADRRSGAVRSALAGAQIALAFMLVAGASILTLSLYRLTSVDLGIAERDVVTFEVHLPSARYGTERRARFHDELAHRLTLLPGISAAGAVSRLPATGTYHGWGTRPASGPLAGESLDIAPAQQRVVAGSYFETLRIPLLVGRLFDERDHAGVPRVVVVSRSLAERVFPGTDAVGHRLEVIGDTVTIVGVVQDVALTVEGDVAATVYHPHRQFADNRNWALHQVVRAGIDSRRTIAAARDVLHQLDPELVLHQAAPLEDVLGRGVAQRRFTAWLMTGFAGLALFLATTGLFGVVAYVVRQRWRELGIRLALGARPAQIGRLVLGQGLRVAAFGIAAGLLGAAALSRVLASLIFQTEPADPRVLAAAAALMAAVAALAAWLPARTATRIEPHTVLAQE